MFENRYLLQSDQTQDEEDFDHSAIELEIVCQAETIRCKRVVICELLICWLLILFFFDRLAATYVLIQIVCLHFTLCTTPFFTANMNVFWAELTISLAHFCVVYFFAWLIPWLQLMAL